MGIIDYYQGDNDKWDAMKAHMKALSAKWLTLLNEEHSDEKFSRTQKIHETLRMRHRGDGDDAYPSRSFVRDYLSKQGYEQIHRRTKKSDTIQAITTPRPLQMIQIGYLYFFWSSSGIEDGRKIGPIDETSEDFAEKEKTVSKLFKDKKRTSTAAASWRLTHSAASL